MKYFNWIKRIIRHGVFYYIKIFIFYIKIELYKRNVIRSNNLIDRFKDEYKGEKCFIIGNGPSLRSEDLEKLKSNNIKCFASNKIHSIFKECEWRPNFYVLQDFTFKSDQFDILKEIMQYKMGECFFSSDFKHILNKIETENSINYFIKKPYSPFIRINEFTDYANLYVIDGATVTYTAIQLAAYMGFEEIYLLGVDCSYSKVISKKGEIINTNIEKDYFSKDYDRNMRSISNVEAMMESYLVAKKYSEKNKINILNATRGGKLEIFERVDFDSLIFKGNNIIRE